MGREMKSAFLFIGIGIVVFAIFAIVNTLCGFHAYGSQNFGPNFTSAMVGAGLGAAVSLVVVLIAFLLQQGSRSSALEPARYLFLCEDGEDLKESYIAFIDTLRIGGQNSVNLSGKSWKALEKEVWPDIENIELVQNDISKSRISGSYSSQAILEKYNRLRESIEEIVHDSATAVFEGKENLIVPVLWEANYNVHALFPKLHQLTVQQEDVDLSSIEKILKDVVVSAGKLLINLCKLGKNIKLK